jgi:hypothetical protein
MLISTDIKVIKSLGTSLHGRPKYTYYGPHHENLVAYNQLSRKGRYAGMQQNTRVCKEMETAYQCIEDGQTGILFSNRAT